MHETATEFGGHDLGQVLMDGYCVDLVLGQVAEGDATPISIKAMK